ncbi:MAG TPA: SpoIID/LytB domain-containing protein [Gaiellaceae bacterium]
MRRLGLLAAALAALACGGLASAVLASGGAPAGTTSTATTSTTTTAVSTAPSVIAFTGHGWGHGLGLSQWGAYGYAKHGWTYDRILAHYYPGTTLGQATVKTVRVLVAAEKKVTLSSLLPWTVTDSAGAKTKLDPGDLKLGAALSVNGTATQPPLVVTSKQPVLVDGHAYRGKLMLSTDGRLVSVVDAVALEQYVKGVVPAEMPPAWSPEALKAQAVAARSYALANLAKGRPFDLYGDTRSQVYGGVAAETQATNAAVDATKGQVVLYGGKIADTLFFSTSGGRTASALESTGIAVPYLVPVADPYDTLSPYHDWGPVLFDAAAVAKQLKLSGAIVGISATNGASGRVKTVELTADDDSVVTFTGNQLRTALGLRSTWFAPALLQLLPATKTITYGGAVSLTGSAPDGASLEAKPYGLDWTPAGDVAAGSFAEIVKPQSTTWYRLAWGDARVGLAKIAVAARVAITASQGAVSGNVRPATAGAPCRLQQQAGAWATVATTATDAAGAWTFPAPASGTYRVRCAPGHGVAAGVTAAFAVS